MPSFQIGRQVFTGLYWLFLVGLVYKFIEFTSWSYSLVVYGDIQGLTGVEIVWWKLYMMSIAGGGGGGHDREERSVSMVFDSVLLRPVGCIVHYFTHF